MDLNHVMVYTRDVQRSLDFYATALGLTVIESIPQGGYARLKLPSGSATLALHAVEPGNAADAPGIRLYFEVPNLDAFCAELESRGVALKQKPADMPWGWRHAYIDDPDGHEISLYSAGEKRLRPTPFSR
jgi:catechol 2,3-dioxygenase-like lactoylglutathione lyase family enzyme